MKPLNDRLQPALLLLEQMVNMDSPSLDKGLVDRFSRFVGEAFSEIGGRVEFVPSVKAGDHLIARFGDGANSILLLGHTDTVFGPGEAARRPFRIENGRATGPGVFDMKAGIVLALWALDSLTTTQLLHRPVTVLLTSDEEIGSTWSRDLIETEARRAKAVLVLEPSLPGGALKTARKGVGRFTIKALGKAAHSGVDPENGVNAIEEIAHQVLQLQALTDLQCGTTVNVGVIQGGSRTNVVPAEAAIDVDVRIASVTEGERLTQKIRSLKAKTPGATLEIRGGLNRPPMERTADTARLFSIAQSLAREIGIELSEGSTGGASDGNFTAALGLPTLDGLGAVGDFAHGQGEYIDVESLPARAALIAGLIQKI